jgi:glutaredoxin 2
LVLLYQKKIALMPPSLDELIERFDECAHHAVVHAASSAEIRAILRKIQKITEQILPRMKVTALRLELQDFYNSLFWNVKRLLHEPGSAGAFSSINNNRRGVLRLRAPRSLRLQAELQAAHRPARN